MKVHARYMGKLTYACPKSPSAETGALSFEGLAGKKSAPLGNARWWSVVPPSDGTPASGQAVPPALITTSRGLHADGPDVRVAECWPFVVVASKEDPSAICTDALAFHRHFAAEQPGAGRPSKDLPPGR